MQQDHFTHVTHFFFKFGSPSTAHRAVFLNLGHFKLYGLQFWELKAGQVIVAKVKKH